MATIISMGACLRRANIRYSATVTVFNDGSTSIKVWPVLKDDSPAQYEDGEKNLKPGENFTWRFVFPDNLTNFRFNFYAQAESDPEVMDSKEILDMDKEEAYDDRSDEAHDLIPCHCGCHAGYGEVAAHDQETAHVTGKQDAAVRIAQICDCHDDGEGKRQRQAKEGPHCKELTDDRLPGCDRHREQQL